MNQSTRRWLELEGAQNCRDLGGIPVSEGRTKYNRIYRGDALHELSNSDQARLEALQLSAIIDFRSDFERRAAPNKLSDVLLSKVRAESFIPQKTHALFDKVNNGELSGPEARQSMCEQYRILTLEHTDIYGRVIDNIIALNDASVLFHCTSGKDRTGIMAAILLAAVGASEDEIVADYLLTNGRIKPVAYLNEAVDEVVVRHLMAAAPEYITTALQTMASEYGSLDNYLLKAIGLTNAKRQSLANSLVE